MINAQGGDNPAVCSGRNLGMVFPEGYIDITCQVEADCSQRTLVKPRSRLSEALCGRSSSTVDCQDVVEGFFGCRLRGLTLVSSGLVGGPPLGELVPARNQHFHGNAEAFFFGLSTRRDALANAGIYYCALYTHSIVEKGTNIERAVTKKARSRPSRRRPGH
eukprot:1196365-Prorocentrum_minimum.AAC.1